MSKERHRVIELTKGYVAIISARHFRKVNRHSWRVHFSRGKNKQVGQPYARTTIKGKDVYLHRFLMQEQILERILGGCTDNERLWHVDHRNTQTLDCRDENLEVVFYTENQKRRVERRKRKRGNSGKHNHDGGAAGVDGGRPDNDCQGMDVQATAADVVEQGHVAHHDVGAASVVDARVRAA